MLGRLHMQAGGIFVGLPGYGAGALAVVKKATSGGALGYLDFSLTSAAAESPRARSRGHRRAGGLVWMLRDKLKTASRQAARAWKCGHTKGMQMAEECAADAPQLCGRSSRRRAGQRQSLGLSRLPAVNAVNEAPFVSSSLAGLSRWPPSSTTHLSRFHTYDDTTRASHQALRLSCLETIPAH